MCTTVFSWAEHDSESAACRQHLQEATRLLVKELIPDTAREWIDNFYVPDVDSVSVKLHAAGINMRHIGLLRSHFYAHKDPHPASAVLLAEMVKRVIKNIVRARLRGDSKNAAAGSQHHVCVLTPWLFRGFSLMVAWSVHSRNAKIFDR